MEDGTYMQMTKEDITHMNTTSGKKLSYDTLNLPQTEQKRGGTRTGGRSNGYRKPRMGCGKGRNPRQYSETNGIMRRHCRKE
eukprot:748236-Pleurochrysis_carterae.AAC.1